MTPRAQVGVAAVTLAYVVAWAGSAAILHGRSDLEIFFWPAAQTVATGHPLNIYSTSTGGAGPFSNGPIGLAPLAALAALANAAHWADSSVARTVSANVVYSVFALLMAKAAVDAVATSRGADAWRISVLSTFLLAPVLWISVADFGHFEQPIELWLVLLALASALRGNSTAAGIALGLAILTRTTALLYLVPMALLIAGRGAPRAGIRLLVTAAATTLVGFAPFFAADAANAVHSLITYRGSEPIAGGSVMVLALGRPWQGFAQHADIYLAVAAAWITCVVVVLWLRWIRGSAASACGLLTVAAACFPLLAKTVYPYYFLEPYVFSAVWCLARPGLVFNWRVVVPILISVDAILAVWRATSPISTPGLVEGVVSSVLVAAVVLLVAWDLSAGSSELELRDEAAALSGSLGETQMQAAGAH